MLSENVFLFILDYRQFTKLLCFTSCGLYQWHSDPVVVMLLCHALENPITPVAAPGSCLLLLTQPQKCPVCLQLGTSMESPLLLAAGGYKDSKRGMFCWEKGKGW